MKFTTRSFVVAALMCGAIVVQAGTAHANKCSAGKVKCVVNKTKALLGCQGKAAGKGLAVDPACVQKAQAKFDGGADPAKGCFEKLEAKGEKAGAKPADVCPTSNDTAALEAKVDAFVADLVSDVYPAVVPNKCAAGKEKCSATKVGALLGCYSKGFGKGLPVDAACVQKGKAKFDGGADPTKGCFEKLEAKGEKAGAKPEAICPTTDDTAAIEAKIDAFVADVTCAVEPSSCTGPTPSPTATPTATTTPAPTSTPGVCGDGQVQAGEFCDPPGTGGECGTDFACVNCNCACPSKVHFSGDSADPKSILDTGWTGISHRAPIISNGDVTVALSCAAAQRPCGVCNISGPIANTNAGNGELDNRRCTNDTAIKCTDNTPCVGGGGTCQFFFGSNLALAAGGVSTCVVNQFNGNVTGTADVETGDAKTAALLTSTVYNGLTIDSPCPRCGQFCAGGSNSGAACTTASECPGGTCPSGFQGFNDGVADGVCDAGPHAGQPCDANGGVSGRPDFGITSLDCPPDGAAAIATLPIDLSNSTGVVTKTLTTASPNCTGSAGDKCLCDTCNNANAEPCSTNADCPQSGGIPGICGGRRCVGGSEIGRACGSCSGGTNQGANCSTATQCPGGTCLSLTCAGGGSCTRPGEPTAPSKCLIDPNTSENCVDPDGDGEGGCTNGPIDGTCSVASGHAQRSCGTTADCGGAPGSCLQAPRTCFPTGGGTFQANPQSTGTDTLSAIGMADLPVSDVSHPTLGAVFCVGPTNKPAINSVAGIPGPGRVTIKGTATGRP